MATLSEMLHALIPPTQRQTAAEVTEALDLGSGDRVGKRSGFLIMLTLAGIIAIAAC
jgi:hypothetical protein